MEIEEQKIIRIGIDAMGGDHAPSEIINGVVDYINANKKERSIVTLIGDSSIIESKLMNYNVNLDRIEIVHAKQIIKGDDQPMEAIAKKKNSSMVIGLTMLKEGRIDAFVSAGNTGALVAGGTVLVGRIKGIKRPALALFLPNMSGASLMLDCGANVDARPDFLAQFAYMGSLYAQNELGIKNPTVGLVNIGEEEEKGNKLVRETYQLLKKSGLNFVGNVETRDIPKGGVDVLVCDAFVGNVILKHSEGMVKEVFGLIKKELNATITTKLGALMAKDAFKNIKKKFDYSEYGGAPLLGLKNLVVKAHGNSKRAEVKACLLQCEKFVKGDIANKIENAMLEDEINEKSSK